MSDPLTQLSASAHKRGLRVAVAESLTSGLLASEVGKGEDAASWFAGGVVAYQMSVKTALLGVRQGVDPCSAECATSLATGVRSLLDADIAVATTGVGGPESEDGHPPGTVFIGWATADHSGFEQLRLSGKPDEILRETVHEGLRLLARLAASAQGTG